MEDGKKLEVTIDLETLDLVGSRKKMATILSIGAVAFDPTSQLHPSQLIDASLAEVLRDAPNTQVTTDTLFYTPVSLMQSMIHGFTAGESTLRFWQEQKYNMLAVAANHVEPIEMTFERLAVWLKRVGAKRVWANAPVFDISILRNAFDHVGLELEIDFRAERDIRTARDFAEVKEATQKTPDYFIQHHALFDSAWEATVVQAMYAKRIRYEGLASANVELLAQLAAVQDELALLKAV